MSKKILSVVLALVLVMSSFVVAAFAANNVSFEDAESTNTQTWALSEPVTTDGVTYTVDVSLTTNYPTGAIEFVIEETDKDNVIELDSMATKGSAIKYDAEISADPDTGKVVIVPQTTANATLVTATAINGVIATLTYTYTGTGSAQIAIKNDPKTETNQGGSLIALRMEEANIVNKNVVAGQKVASVGDAKTIGSAAEPPTLAVKAGTNGVINTKRTVVDSYNDVKCTGYIYGVEPGKALNTVFEVVGDGTMQVVADGKRECATGTTVNVLDLDGNVVETYIFILFGDVTCDGIINSVDAGDIGLHEVGLWGYNLETEENIYEDLGYDGKFPEYKIFAGNVDGNTVTNSVDAGNVALHEVGLWGYNLETEENYYEDLGLDGKFTQEYIISNLK